MATDAVKVLVTGLTDGGKVYAAGQVVLDASDGLLACADSGRKNDAGVLLCKRLSKQEVVKAAKAADRKGADEPLVSVPSADYDEDDSRVVNEEVTMEDLGGGEDEDDEDE